MATATTMLDAVVKPDPTESAALGELKEQIDAAFSAGYTPCLIDRDGNSIELPESVFEALTFVVRGMASGHTMTLMPSAKLLTTRQAADMLQVSRPHLIKLLDEDKIPYELVGTHRRIRVQDVLDYRRSRAACRREVLRDLTKDSAAEDGGYR